MKVAIAPAVVESTNCDALRRIRAAARRGWRCRLRAGHVLVIAADIAAWRERGLGGYAERRIRLAADARCGVRLSAEECRDIVEAAA